MLKSIRPVAFASAFSIAAFSFDHAFSKKFVAVEEDAIGLTVEPVAQNNNYVLDLDEFKKISDGA